MIGLQSLNLSFTDMNMIDLKGWTWSSPTWPKFRFDSDLLIEPLSRHADTRFLHAIAEMHERRECGFMATLFARDDIAARPRRLVHGSDLMWSDVDDAQTLRKTCA